MPPLKTRQCGHMGKRFLKSGSNRLGTRGQNHPIRPLGKDVVLIKKCVELYCNAQAVQLSFVPL